jgi:hypothetical protein
MAHISFSLCRESGKGTAKIHRMQNAHAMVKRLVVPPAQEKCQVCSRSILSGMCPVFTAPPRPPPFSCKRGF